MVHMVFSFTHLLSTELERMWMELALAKFKTPWLLPGLRSYKAIIFKFKYVLITLLHIPILKGQEQDFKL